MADDAVPQPPGANDQGFPGRPLPYSPAPGNLQFVRCKLQPGQETPLIALIYDSPDARVVSYWAEEAFVQLAKRMLAFTGTPQLTLADQNDIASLRHAGQFLDKPGGLTP